MKSIVWLALGPQRHMPTPSELLALRRLFVSVKVTTSYVATTSPQGVISRLRRGNHPLVLIADPVLVSGVCASGLRPLVPLLEPVGLAAAELVDRGHGVLEANNESEPLSIGHGYAFREFRPAVGMEVLYADPASALFSRPLK